MANETTPIFTQPLIIFGNPEVGSPVHFDTRVQLHDHMNILWYKDGIVLQEGGRFILVNNNGHLSLSIFNAVPADSGLYCAYAVNQMGFSGVEAFLNLMPAAPAVPHVNQLPAVIAAAIDDAAIDGQLNNFPNIANPPPDNIDVNDVHPQLHMLAIEWYPEKNPLQLQTNGDLQHEDVSNVCSSSENVPLDGASKNLKRVFVDESANSPEDQLTKRLKLNLKEETTHQEANLSLPPPNQVDLNPVIPQPSVQEENSDDTLNTH